VSFFGGSAWTWDDVRGQFFFHQYAVEQPDLNTRNPRVLEELKVRRVLEELLGLSRSFNCWIFCIVAQDCLKQHLDKCPDYLWHNTKVLLSRPSDMWRNCSGTLPPKFCYGKDLKIVQPLPCSTVSILIFNKIWFWSWNFNHTPIQSQESE